MALGAPRFWVAAGASNWNNAANWSSTTGVITPAAVPVAGDAVTFDGTGTGNCTIDVAVSVTSLVVSGFTGMISQGANAITVSSFATFVTGTFIGGSANIDITGVFTLSGTAFTSTSATLELQNNAAFTSNSFTHNNGKVQFNTSIAAETISGTSPAFYALEFVGINRSYTVSSTPDITVANNLILSGAGFYNLLLGTIDVNGDINVTNSATGCGGTTMINIIGTGTQNFNGNTTAGTGALPQLTINKSSGTLNLANFPGVSNSFTYTAGTLSPGTSTFCFTHGSVAAYSITGSLSLTNIEFTMNNSLSTITIAAATTLTATGNLAIDGAGGVLIQTGNINVNGNILLTNTANNGGGTATINIVGAGAETMDGTAITVNESRLPLININNSGGTLSLAGNISFSANVSYTAGTISPGTSTCYIVNNLAMTGTFSLYNLTVSAAANTTVIIASGSTVTATNTLDLENAANAITINTGTLAVQGNLVDNNTSTTAGGTGTILIDGTGPQTITSTGVIDQGRLPAVTIDNTGGTVTFPALLTVTGNWTYTAGTLDVTTNNSTVVFEGTLNITGSHTLNNITIDGSNNFTFTTAAGTTLTVSGNMNMIGTGNITLATGTIDLDGNLVLTNTGAGGGTSVLSFTGGANQAITSALLVNQNCLPAITINKTGGTLSFPALITAKGNWTYTAGAIDVTTNNSTVVFASPLGSTPYTITGNLTLNNVTFEGNTNNTATVSTGTIITVTGTLTTTGAANTSINTTIAGATAIQAQGNITINNTSAGGGGTGVLVIDGSGAQLFSSTSSASQGIMANITIQKTTGTLTLSGVISESRNWTYTSGTVDATTNTSTVVFGGNNLAIASAGMSFYNIVFTANTSTLSNNLTVNNNLTISGLSVLAPVSNTINIAGNWSDWGTTGFTELTSTVNFDGAALQTITVPGGENFTNFTVNNTGSGVQLENALAVATSLNMTQGNIDLNTNTLTLGTAGTSALLAGTLNYTQGSMINTGTFTRWFAKLTIAAGGAAGLFPMGTVANPRPFGISVTAAPTTAGTISVAYTDAATTSTVSFADGGSTVMARKDLNWGVSTALLAGGTYNLGISGTGYGTVGNVTDLRLTLAGSVIGSPGTNAGTVTDPQVNRTGLTATNLANTFYLGSINSTNSPLPVNLISFTATVENGGVVLNWSTAQEINNDFFMIQRSKDAINWTDVERVAGAGNSSTVTSYTGYDPTPDAGSSYYRLIQTDLDGNQTYSALRSVSLQALAVVSVYPNPASDLIRIGFPGTGMYAVDLLNNIGQRVMSAISVNAGTIGLPVSGLQDGIYFIRIIHAGTEEVVKVVVKK